MKKNIIKLLYVLLTFLMLFSVMSCNQEAAPEIQPVPDDPVPDDPVVEYTTDYYMPAGWSVTTPVWTSKAVDTVTVPDVVLSGDMKTGVTNVTPELKAALAEALATPGYFKDVKNVIIIIGDGMGITHVQASEQWSGELIMTQLPNIGAASTLTREGGDIVTDSAAGGTALSTGYKTTKLFASIDAEGNELKSVSELAREQGKLVGIVTNAELADATPADFSVHNKNRSQGWTKICQQEIVFGADLFMGNGLEDYADYFETDNDMYAFVEANNMKLYSTASDIVNHFADDSKMWAIFDATANKFARFDTAETEYPNLQQMTAYALSWLDDHADEDKGFVVMIENTYTDHFGHGNKPLDKSDNTYGIVKEVQSCDEAVAIALKYVLEHPDTALIVTADHETGNTRLRDGWEEDFSKIKATSGDHSQQTVPVFAIGQGTEALNSLAEGKAWYEATPYENARIGQVIGALLGDNEFGGDVNSDNSSKRSPKFDVTVTEATDTLTFTLDLTGVPVRSGNYIQFKIKPMSASDSIKVDLTNNKGVAVNQLAETVFSTATDSIAKDKNGNVTTVLTNAYKQAFVKDSGKADDWYQLSIKSKTPSTKITITLKGSFAVDDVIGMDDLTIQYGSTFGQLVFASEKATASGACLVTD